MKPTKIFSENPTCPGWEMNFAPPEHTSEIPLEPAFSVVNKQHQRLLRVYWHKRVKLLNIIQVQFESQIIIADSINTMLYTTPRDNHFTSSCGSNGLLMSYLTLFTVAITTINVWNLDTLQLTYIHQRKRVGSWGKGVRGWSWEQRGRGRVAEVTSINTYNTGAEK